MRRPTLQGTDQSVAVKKALSESSKLQSSVRAVLWTEGSTREQPTGTPLTLEG